MEETPGEVTETKRGKKARRGGNRAASTGKPDSVELKGSGHSETDDAYGENHFHQSEPVELGFGDMRGFHADSEPKVLVDPSAQESDLTGLPPGTLVYTGLPKTEPIHIGVTRYNNTEFEYKSFARAADLEFCVQSDSLYWVTVDGIHQTEVVEELGNLFGVHPLTMEDILNPGQRPKSEIYEDYLFIVMKYPSLTHKNQVEWEQISIVSGKGYVLQFRERRGDEFAAIRNRIKRSGGQMRKRGADYLVYSLLDLIVDQTLAVINKFADQIEMLEEGLLEEISGDTPMALKRYHREVISMRKQLRPIRDMIHRLQRQGHPYFQKKTRVYLQDVYDHIIQAYEQMDVFRDLLANMSNLYLSSLSQKTNEAMKFLTMIGTIFIPLTFIAGVYGMNFDFMPELHWTYGYPVVMGFMLVTGFLLAWYFKRRNWM